MVCFRILTSRFRGDYTYGVGRAWDREPNGDRFLMIQALDVPAGGKVPRINVVVNWFEELKERVPVP